MSQIPLHLKADVARLDPQPRKIVFARPLWSRFQATKPRKKAGWLVVNLLYKNKHTGGGLAWLCLVSLGLCLGLGLEISFGRTSSVVILLCSISCPTHISSVLLSSTGKRSLFITFLLFRGALL